MDCQRASGHDLLPQLFASVLSCFQVSTPMLPVRVSKSDALAKQPLDLHLPPSQPLGLDGAFQIAGATAHLASRLIERDQFSASRLSHVPILFLSTNVGNRKNLTAFACRL
ncbi:hypothetical protein BFL28_10735 [Sphingomonas turrisvirgatae]|uniref:Uncharacterized protein n=1 Tax=Sphingomonas turrisvirgatae TaxID=1888892 RepID=A0A1E3LZT1_9SPHN|nr:hypothetical protein BFL28_10735 [Sphingomonas turrisvirgatae]